MAYRSGDSDADLLRRYLHEIEAHPRLTAAEERELGSTMAAGGRKADAARRRLLQTNLRLVVDLAARHEGRGIALLDLIQEGNLGLMRAVDRFEPDGPTEFSATAEWFVRQAINRLFNDSERHQYPLHDPGFIVPPEEPDTGDETPAVRPLTALPGGTGGEPAGDGPPAPYELAAEALEREALELQLEWLSQREQLVLRLRFGLDDTGEMTPERMAESLEVTKEHLRQIEKKAMSKLRHPSVARLWTANQRKATGT